MYLSQWDRTPPNKPIFSDFHGFEWGYPPANPSNYDRYGLGQQWDSRKQDATIGLTSADEDTWNIVGIGLGKKRILGKRHANGMFPGVEMTNNDGDISGS